jgi:hypothetical protein
MASLGVKLTRPLPRLAAGAGDTAMPPATSQPSGEAGPCHASTTGVGTTTVAGRPSRLARLCSQLSPRDNQLASSCLLPRQ